MTSWGRAIKFGVLMWLIPFVVAVFVFPFKVNARPLFESIMAVAVTAGAVFLGLKYFSKIEAPSAGDGLTVGFLWAAISIVIDAPLMLAGGPMQMSAGAYMADIGLTYLIIPLVTLGLAVSRTLPRRS